MKKIYQNFDGLDVSFQCCLPAHVLEVLARSKEEAQQTRQPVLCYVGQNALPVMVAETGAKGGYAYRFDTGMHGAIWFVADSIQMDHWSVRVSVKSLMLALHGYFETKDRILKTLVEDLEAVFPYNQLHPLERVSRFDFCIDFASEEFLPNHENFISHNRSRKSTQFDNKLVLTERGRKIETITIGKMPNRQMCFYDKKREITATSKSYWWNIWNLSKSEFQGNIWRVELRAGKKELNKWQIRRFADFEKKGGDVIVSILESTRYVIPNPNDKNSSRWETADFWKTCLKIAKKHLEGFISHANREEIISDYRENIVKNYEAHICGVITSYSAALGRDVSQIPGVLDLVASGMAEKIRQNPQKFSKKYKKAEEKFKFLDPQKNNPGN